LIALSKAHIEGLEKYKYQVNKQISQKTRDVGVCCERERERESMQNVAIAKIEKKPIIASMASFHRAKQEKN
jgi:hypothetical protein